MSRRTLAAALAFLAALACSSGSPAPTDAGAGVHDALASSADGGACSGIPKCVFVPVAMCAGVAGCVRQGGCTGTPVQVYDCTILTAEAACLTQPTCQWNGHSGSCDTAIPFCEANPSPVPCNTEQGCSWFEPSCNGSPRATCEEQTAATCTDVPGCSLH